ncbi:MAG: hypothetical protein FJY29_10440 [Betaproteobacteria bacterium]|nr:hypothetical protein [Betaproteobacteria bacterium]
MIRAFAPALGDFRGTGEMRDGTELRCSFSGKEMIPGVCYGLRLEVTTAESEGQMMNVYFVLSQDHSEHLEIQYFDGREQLHALHAVDSPMLSEHPAGRVFSFEGQRPNGTVIRFHFDLVSSERIDITMDSNTTRSTTVEERCCLRLERVHESIMGSAA